MFKNKHHLYWLIPAFIYIISSFFSVINVDGVRDYLAAYKIVHELQFPLVGPQMAFSFHVGPLWYYIMSIPLLFFNSWTAMAVFVGFLTILKFVYAYKLGRLFLGRNFAVILIATMMLASFTLVQQITFTHTNLIEFAVLFIIYYCQTFNSSKYLSWFFLGIYFAIALHIHPTTAIVSFWVILKLIKTQSWIKSGLVAFLGILIVFLPIIINEINNNFENINGALVYFSHNTNSKDFLGFFKLTIGTVFVTAFDSYRMLFPYPISVLIFTIHAFFILFIFSLNFYCYKHQNKQVKQLIKKLLLFLIYSLLFVFFIRKSTPWYMTYSITLSFNLFFSISIWSIANKYNLYKFIHYFYSIALIIFISLLASMAVKLNQNKILPAATAWNNIRTLSIKLMTQPGYEIPAYLASSHAQYLCINAPVSVHGSYAALINSHSGIEFLSKCPSQDLYYGNANDTTPLFAVSDFFAQDINISPIHRINGTNFYKPLSISPLQQVIKENYLSRYDKTYNQVTHWQNNKISLELKHGQYLAITRVLGGFSQLIVDSISANGNKLKPLKQSNYSYLYYCKSCKSVDTVWNISYFESVKGMTNIVTF